LNLYCAYFFTHENARSKLTSFRINALYLEWAESGSELARRS